MSTVETTTCLFQIPRDELLHSLKQVSGVVEQSQVMQILSFVLLTGKGSSLSVLASNSEVEVVTEAKLFEPSPAPFSITVSCKKLMDICRALPDGAIVELHQSSQWIMVKTIDSQFKLATLPADSFPKLPSQQDGKKIRVVESVLKENIEKTCFSMACQDARFFLNGLLLSTEDGMLNCVATDGHRLSWEKFIPLEAPLEDLRAIIPRKTVLELAKLLRNNEESLDLVIGEQFIEVSTGHFKLRSNLIEGQYPKFKKLIPSSINDTAVVESVVLKQALDRVAILANEKFKGARFTFENGQLNIVSSNFDQEEAVSSIQAKYTGSSRTVAFNINYILDVLGVVETDEIMFHFSDAVQGVLLEAEGGSNSGAYVVMPLTL